MLPIRKSQDECPVRYMKDSYQEVIIPLEHNARAREKYVSFNHGIRIGRLLEDLDILAVWICYIHNQDPSNEGQHLKSTLYIVTALVDRIDLHDYTFSPFKDVKMCGHVTWVGKSSMEVTMIVGQETEGAMQLILTAHFVMVVRNSHNNKAAVVNPLKPEGEQESAMLRLGDKNKIIRQEKAKMSLLKRVPTTQERHLIHSIFLETIDQNSQTFSVRVKPNDSVWMEETNLKSMNICHPEQRNIYNKIFGGFLMRQAYELALANAAIFSRCIPTVRVIDDIIFLQPVEIGSLVTFSAQCRKSRGPTAEFGMSCVEVVIHPVIVYTEGTLMQVKVHAEVLCIQTNSHETTNEFYFVFDSNQRQLPRVLPCTYAESMLYLDCMRHMTD